MNIAQYILEIIIGRLVLELPEKDLKKINKILQKHYGVKESNAKVQQEDNSINGL